MLKHLFKKPSVQKALSRLLAGYLSLVWHTSRWTIEGQEQALARLSRNRPIILVFWHNRMSMAPFAWLPQYPFHMLISQHSDGQLISKTVAHLGIDTIAGSSSQGGALALRQLVDQLRQGKSVGITPDGPRGPREELKPGVFMLSLLSRCEVVALSFSMSREITLPSWDKLRIPLPFGRGALVYAESAQPTANKTNKEAFLEALKTALDKAHTRAQRLVRSR